MSPHATHATTSSPLDEFLPEPHFVERHERLVRAPVSAVWAAATSVTPAEVRLLAPLMALRSVPRLLAGERQRSLRSDDASLLEAFAAEGFVELRRDAAATQGRAAVVYGAAGRFWSPADSSAVPLVDAGAFALHQAPGTARTAFSLEVAERDEGVLLTTETRVVGSDEAARRAFGRYWLIIRGPSGLIRRSWLAAIDRRARG